MACLILPLARHRPPNPTYPGCRDQRACEKGQSRKASMSSTRLKARLTALNRSKRLSWRASSTDLAPGLDQTSLSSPQGATCPARSASKDLHPRSIQK